MWPFKKQLVLGPLVPGVTLLIDACKKKDAELYDRLSLLPVNEFWQEWQRRYPEDFPQGELSIPGPHCITQNDTALQTAH